MDLDGLRMEYAKIYQVQEGSARGGAARRQFKFKLAVRLN